MAEHKLEMDTNCNLNQTMLRLGFKILGPEAARRVQNDPTNAQDNPKMAQQRLNIAPMANKSAKPTQIQSQRNHASVGIEIFSPKAANRPQNAQQKHNIAPKSPNKSPTNRPMASQTPETDPKFNPNGTMRPLGLKFYHQRTPTDSPKWLIIDLKSLTMA